VINGIGDYLNLDGAAAGTNNIYAMRAYGSIGYGDPKHETMEN
jgi:hypothetical protein